jgi:hypothetical protein
MRTMLQERHRHLFSALAPEQMTLVWNRVVQAWPTDMRQFLATPPNNSGGLFEVCRDAGLDHARVVLSLATEYNAVGRGTIETLVGHPIVPWAATVEAEERLRNPPPVRSTVTPAIKVHDARVVISVAPNPHREDTGMYRAYQRWVVGAVVGDLLQRGMPSRSVRRDIRHGYVVVGVGS